MAKLVRSFGNSMVNFLFDRDPRHDKSGLIRMFETEYRKEYNWARKSGTQIDESFVRSFLASNKAH